MFTFALHQPLHTLRPNHEKLIFGGDVKWLKLSLSNLKTWPKSTTKYGHQDRSVLISKVRKEITTQSGAYRPPCWKQPPHRKIEVMFSFFQRCQPSLLPLQCVYVWLKFVWFWFNFYTRLWNSFEKLLSKCIFFNFWTNKTKQHFYLKDGVRRRDPEVVCFYNVPHHAKWCVFAWAFFLLLFPRLCFGSSLVRN